MLSSSRVSFIQQIFIEHVLCSRPCFKSWECSSHLAGLGREKEREGTAAAHFTDEETDPKRLSDLPKSQQSWDSRPGLSHA